MTEPTVLYEVSESIATITMNRPHALNAFDRDMFAALATAFTDFERDPTAHVAILTGSGSKAFCAGLDLKERLDGDAAGLGFPDISPLENPFWPRRDNQLSKPVIAAVNGYAMGGGFYLALQADLCIASDTAQFEISEIARGCVAGWETGYLHALPLSAWTEIAYGARISAKRAYDIGIVVEVVAPDALMDAARARARGILRVPPLVLMRNRELLTALRPSVPPEIWARESEYIEECRVDPDAAEAVTAFVERRVPQWVRDKDDTSDESKGTQ